MESLDPSKSRFEALSHVLHEKNSNFLQSRSGNVQVGFSVGLSIIEVTSAGLLPSSRRLKGVTIGVSVLRHLTHRMMYCMMMCTSLTRIVKVS